MEHYPAIAFILRWGHPLVIALAACFPVAALALVAQGWNVLIVPAGLIAGIVAYGLLRSYVEKLRVISATMIPK